MLKRAITGAVFVAIVIGSFTLHRWSAFSLTTLICVLAFNEFSRIVKSKDLQFNHFTWLLFIPLILGNAPINFDFDFITLFYVIVPIILITELYRNKTNPIQNIAVSLFGFIYAAMPMFIFLSSYSKENDNYYFPIAMGYFILIWANDTFAYLSGRFFGRTKLFERISPKKTWEGSIGGGILTIGAAYFISSFWTELLFFDWAIIACIAIVFGGLGDLVESMFKRSLDIKDSGNILPGHGGILDRFDAAILGAPVLYFFVSNFINA